MSSGDSVIVCARRLQQASQVARSRRVSESDSTVVL